MEIQLQNMAKIIGDPVRATVLWTLLDGKAYTASELAAFTETSLPNMSMHLNKLIDADLLAVEKQGRHRYFRFSRDEVAYAIEGLTNLLPLDNNRTEQNKNDICGIKYCRTCYDHLAGQAGVKITEQLIKKRIIFLDKNKQFVVTTQGESFFKSLQIDTDALRKKRRFFAKPCLDWTERKYHLAGALGAALLEKMLREDWMRRKRNSREIIITAKGQKAVAKTLKINL